MTKKKSKKDEEKKLEYRIMGDAFLGELSNISGEEDSSLQNLIISMESKKIQKSLKNNK